ncbi:phage tail tip lysozyme [Halocynthiibacter sp. C4]|uniref:phage tail tip lysozyme n=1 Tax=Halocynthiibacter sp. C4 TaxID=2992758 RepID=UPI00237C4FC5|nr:phage tail tip lysozyme [Halocynthiibacter sp. C4]MDE0590418.1 phage tail tip lysozyme [Halocynthiibacter sp. C4]
MEREVIQGLIARGVPEHIAYGIGGNISVESGFNSGINEINPVVEGSRGGFGLNQWTGPRRTQLEAFAADLGVAPDDMDAQLDFTLWELLNTEKRAAEALFSASTPEEAARIYSDQFLRPGIPHLDRRIAEAARLAGGEYKTSAHNGGQGYSQNALAKGFEPKEQKNALYQAGYAGLDPSQFQSNRNQLAQYDFNDNPYLRALS